MNSPPMPADTATTDVSNGLPFSLDGGIIAGGLGSRMHGQDKGLLELNNVAFAQSITRALRPYVGQLIINCNRNHTAYAQFADQVVGDLPREVNGQTQVAYDGPMAGITAILKSSKAHYVLFSPCDTPCLPDSYVPRMLNCLRDSGYSPENPRIVIASDGERWHPLHVLMPIGYADSITEFLAAGERKVMFWLKQRNPLICDFSDCPDAFFNVNSPSDLESLSLT